MAKYVKMNEVNRQESRRKIQLAVEEIRRTASEGKSLSVSELSQNTGLSRGFFYKNEEVKSVLEEEWEKIDQGKLTQNKQEVCEKSMEKQVEIIEEIFLESTGEVFRYNQSHISQEEHALVHEILYESKITKKNIYILNLTEDGITISAGLERNNNSVSFISFAKGQPKLFCDFPLIGTDDFPFPVVINSSDFNPTKPRDGIYLSCKSIH